MVEESATLKNSGRGPARAAAGRRQGAAEPPPQPAEGEVGVGLADDAADRPAGGPVAEPFLCFERRSPTDLRVGGRKLVGSAQRRTRRDALHHGSIPLGTEPSDPARFTLSAAAGRPVEYHEVAAALAAGFEEALGLDLRPGALGPEEVHAAERLAREKHGAEWWLLGRP